MGFIEGKPSMKAHAYIFSSFETPYKVYIGGDGGHKCHTLAEAYLYAAKRFHELGMLELQNRINRL
jgi:hypothetical protein